MLALRSGLFRSPLRCCSPALALGCCCYGTRHPSEIPIWTGYAHSRGQSRPARYCIKLGPDSPKIPKVPAPETEGVQRAGGSQREGVHACPVDTSLSSFCFCAEIARNAPLLCQFQIASLKEGCHTRSRCLDYNVLIRPEFDESDVNCDAETRLLWIRILRRFTWDRGS